MNLSRPPLTRLAALLLAAAIAGCATPDSRIRDQQAAFDRYPPEVQQKIRAGQIDVGYTADMVRMALGEPDQRLERTTAEGASEIWAYRDSRPAFSLGIGGGSFGGSTGLGGGIGVGTGGEVKDRLRVVFQNGRVSAIETMK